MPRSTANDQLRSALTTYLDDVLEHFSRSPAGKKAADPRKGPQHPYIRFVNREAERLLRAFRASVKHDATALPGRLQKGAVDAAVRAATPKIAKALKPRKQA